MSKLEVNILRLENQTIYGVWKNSNDKTVSEDIKSLSEKYNSIISSSEESPLPFYVLSRNYNQETKDFEIFVGSTTQRDNLESLMLPAGEYASITIKPKFGFLWGTSIGEAKRYFYTKWLPETPYNSKNIEYEYHTEKSKGKHPAVDIIFAIGRR
ncbi:MAG: effector binding domain-containing protein [Clostridium sp.]|nr:effector binding domain-containing protein [Clostridium sp.]